MPPENGGGEDRRGGGSQRRNSRDYPPPCMITNILSVSLCYCSPIVSRLQIMSYLVFEVYRKSQKIANYS